MFLTPITKGRWYIIANYLLSHYKGIYRLKTEPDQSTNTFPRKLNGTLEDIDIYIDCQNNNRIFSYGHGILQAYIPSLIRGHNIIKSISEQFGNEIIFDIEETDSEVLFKFNAKYDDRIIPLLKPRTIGSNISPFSSKNLPKTRHEVQSEKLSIYKNIINRIDRKDSIIITKINNKFLKQIDKNGELIRKIHSLNIKLIEYLEMINRLDEYLAFLSEEVDKYERAKNM